MKHLFTLLALTLAFVSCKNNTEQNTEQTVKTEEVKEIAYASFGDKIEANDAIEAKLMADTYKDLTVGDSISTKMVAKVDEVCQAKGCWMKLDLGNNEQVMVKFKDYGFFMPKNIAGKEVIIDGKAYVSELSVEEQRHYAEDAGKSEEEIAAITEPKRTYSFEANGVLLKEE
ncbi:MULTISPECIES: DUF4920 domain-containing protein [Xanthomarina]|jgi:hypothetical protein|uniref:DUF4920 domain-containing protein n=1 Tax=Xanthomarina gelatinilytica TaxID=1137281 RepID=M7MHF4_9FLAO|nr:MULTISPECIES: DUF4920 domain-containing protein [Xanthomarina]EMQ94531.1 hypothetical protein D778_00484 [Xanthomarina gelatinilytica]MBF62328.1 DUF4920 domain-containing protein [Xanthomarina sp.]MDX1316401.1 DUF4920 domain-containing protein [Xanthomarina gelatinilytica]HAI17598.1 DUF4920 domain-containing protein [Xanthomarina gelatinilytica]HCY83478.1 DUF4920 domain-containing protein [Xanthomarina gelatinilytica]